MTSLSLRSDSFGAGRFSVRNVSPGTIRSFGLLARTIALIVAMLMTKSKGVTLQVLHGPLHLQSFLDVKALSGFDELRCSLFRHGSAGF